MIYGFARDVATNLAARGFPVHVTYAGAVIRDGSRGLVIDFSRDYERGDPISDARPGTGPKSPATPLMRWLGVVARIEARSEVAAARSNEHDHALDQLVDALLIEILAWCSHREVRSRVQWGTARPLAPADRKSIGAVYELNFALARSVQERTYSGAARDTASASDVVTSVDASRAGSED